MPMSGRMLPGAWVHMHRMRAYRFLLLENHLLNLNFSCGSYGISQVFAEYSIVNATRTYEKILSVSEPICQSDVTVPAYVEIHGREEEGFPNGTRYDRSGALLCRGWQFSKGDPWTVFTFFRNNWAENIYEVAMHTDFFFYYDSGESVSYDSSVRGEFFNYCNSTDRTNLNDHVREVKHDTHEEWVLQLGKQVASSGLPAPQIMLVALVCVLALSTLQPSFTFPLL